MPRTEVPLGKYEMFAKEQARAAAERTDPVVRERNLQLNKHQPDNCPRPLGECSACARRYGLKKE